MSKTKPKEINSRYLSSAISSDLKNKMVFLGGPRQVGKTTLALKLLKSGGKKNPQYFNYDAPQDRKQIISGKLPFDKPLIVLDEIHKYVRWRNLVKGFFDSYGPDTAFLITGSARLDHYRRGGDSLQGRYHYHRLHPFSLTEIAKNPNQSDTEILLKFGGFPEPFLKQSESFLRRWSLERITRVIKEDVADLENVQQLDLMDILVDALPERVTTPLSLNAIANDLQVSQPTIARWVNILENLYVVFSIAPYGASKIRSVKKEKKTYFWDWTQVLSRGGRLENMLACQLLKYCHFLEDTQGYKMELRYLRDTDGREVDFVVLKNRLPLFAVESKYGDTTISPHCKYFLERTKIPVFYQVHIGTEDFGSAKDATRIIPYWTFCKELGMP